MLVLGAEYETGRLDAERRFVAGLIQDLESGRLDWSTELPDATQIDRLIGEEDPP